MEDFSFSIRHQLSHVIAPPCSWLYTAVLRPPLSQLPRELPSAQDQVGVYPLYRQSIELTFQHLQVLN